MASIRPKISLITTVYNTDIDKLVACIDSVVNQSYENWEWCICNNGSTKAEIATLLEVTKNKYNNIKLSKIDENHGGAAGMNSALLQATGEYIGLLDSDDFLAKECLSVFAAVLMDTKIDIAYSDELLIFLDENKSIPFFKPEYSFELLFKLHYFGHLTVYKKELIDLVKFRECGGSWDYDLALRASSIRSGIIQHIPQILYYYNMYSESTSHKYLNSCIEGALLSLQQHIDNSYLRGGTSIREGNYFGVQKEDGSLLEITESKVLVYGNYENYYMNDLFGRLQ